jgi:hypothetical protein
MKSWKSIIDIPQAHLTYPELKWAVTNIGIVIVLATRAPSVQADDEVVKHELAAQYQKVTIAFQNKDVKSYDALLAPDFENRLPNGKTLSRQQVLADFQRQSANSRDVTWTRNIEKLETAPDGMLVTVSGKFEGLVKDPQGKEHEFRMVATTKDLWEKVSGRWRLKHADLQKMDVSMDGKPVPGPERK